MGATHLNTDAASSEERPDEDTGMQTRFQAPIRHVTPATPEVSVPLNAPPVVTGSHPVISATLPSSSGWYEPSDCGAYTPGRVLYRRSRGRVRFPLFCVLTPLKR